MSTPNPRNIAKKKHYAAIEQANLAAIEQVNNARQALEQAKPKKWLTIAIEVIRVIIAALAGGTGAAIL